MFCLIPHHQTTEPSLDVRPHNVSLRPIHAFFGLSPFHKQCTSSSLSVVLLSSANYTALSRRCRPRASVTTQLRPCKPPLRYPIGCQLLIHLTSLLSPLGYAVFLLISRDTSRGGRGWVCCRNYYAKISTVSLIIIVISLVTPISVVIFKCSGHKG